MRRVNEIKGKEAVQRVEMATLTTEESRKVVSLGSVEVVMVSCRLPLFSSTAAAVTYHVEQEIDERG